MDVDGIVANQQGIKFIFHILLLEWKMPTNPTLLCRLLAQTTLRNILGTKNLHEILSDRESISGSMQVMGTLQEL